MRSQIFAAWAALVALILALLTALAAIAAVRLGQIAFSTGFSLMIPATALAAIALLAALAWLYSALRHNKGAGKRAGLVALAGALVFLYFPLSTQWRGFTMPPIHDASTDPDDPPPFVALAKLRGPGMNSPLFDGQAIIRYQGEDKTIAYALHDYKNGLITKPRNKLMPNSKSPVATLFWRCFEIAKGLGWRIVAYDPGQGRIEATAESFWFGQVSDIVIRVRPAGFMGARYDARAESREGALDYGFNIGLLKAFRDKVGT